MSIGFPSREFDDAVAALCHGTGSEEQVRAMNELLRQNAAARDEYILRVELHARLASQVDLFVSAAAHDTTGTAESSIPFPNGRVGPASVREHVKRRFAWAVGLAACLALLAVAGWRWQRAQAVPDDAVPKVAKTKEDWKPSNTNLPGEEFPRINSERRAQFRIRAPGAKHVSVVIASSDMGMPLTVAKGDDGNWTITTAPLGIGFHFYRVNIDGASVADPATQIFRGGGGDWRSSGIEVPTGEDFHERKSVPHGEVREHRYFSAVTDSWRRAFVYVPPGYERETTTRYPVLYLLHGGGEDETCWPTQGRVGDILDNLIAARKARPMLIVMDSGVARRPGEPETSLRSAADQFRAFATLDDVFMHELIPAIDKTYRTLVEREHRALAGLSVGAAQTFAIGLRNFDRFSALGGFSGTMGGGGRIVDPATAYAGVMADPEWFNRQMRLVFLSVGAEEPDWMRSGVEQYHQALQAAGIEHEFYRSEATGHEWHTWRRSLREFASALFKD